MISHKPAKYITPERACIVESVTRTKFNALGKKVGNPFKYPFTEDEVKDLQGFIKTHMHTLAKDGKIVYYYPRRNRKDKRSSFVIKFDKDMDKFLIA